MRQKGNSIHLWTAENLANLRALIYNDNRDESALGWAVLGWDVIGWKAQHDAGLSLDTVAARLVFDALPTLFDAADERDALAALLREAMPYDDCIADRIEAALNVEAPK